MNDSITGHGPALFPTDAGGASALASRRTVLKAGAGALGLGVAGMKGVSVLAQDATATSDAATAGACVLTPELTEGPYYVDDLLMRADITEGKAGVPLLLKIAVQDASACGPLASAAVDIWHCDAQGYYSGISGENPGGGSAATDDSNLDTTFLRGVQLTGDDGIAQFETIYPGWYTGRTIHIHMKVHINGTAGETYAGGHVSHTGQLFFDDAISDQVFATDAYAGRDNARRLRNDADNILGDHGDEPGFMLTLTTVTEGKIEDGFVGTITLGVDPNATPTETGMGGGQPPNGGNDGPPNGGPGAPPDQTPPSQ